MKMARAAAISAALLAAIPLATPAAADDHGADALTIAELRLATVGRWTGELEYLDYQSGQWFGLPLAVQVEDGGDGATLIRKSDYDDGPQVGNVRIVGAAMYDPETGTEYIGTFRAGRPAELVAYSIRLGTVIDAENWTMIAETDGEDGGEPARIRETTVRAGDRLTTLKEVDPVNDGRDEWITRNRTTLSRTGE